MKKPVISKKRIVPLYKIINHKRVPLCDYEGTCSNKAYKEVYRSLLGGKYKNSGWNYLCRKHFKQEQKVFKGKLSYSSM